MSLQRTLDMEMAQQLRQDFAELYEARMELKDKKWAQG